MSIYKEVQSESDPTIVYPVTLDRMGRWHCDCMSHVMNNYHKCKHIRKIIDELNK